MFCTAACRIPRPGRMAAFEHMLRDHFAEDSTAFQINLNVSLISQNSVIATCNWSNLHFASLYPEGLKQIFQSALLELPCTQKDLDFTSHIVRLLETIRHRSPTNLPHLVLVVIDAFGSNISQWAFVCERVKFRLHVSVLTARPPQKLDTSRYARLNRDYLSAVYSSDALLLAIQRVLKAPISGG